MPAGAWPIESSRPAPLVPAAKRTDSSTERDERRVQRKIVPAAIEVRCEQEHTPGAFLPFEEGRRRVSERRRDVPAFRRHPPRTVEANLAEIGRQGSEGPENRVTQVGHRQHSGPGVRHRGPVRRQRAEDAGQQAGVKLGPGREHQSSAAPDEANQCFASSPIEAPRREQVRRRRTCASPVARACPGPRRQSRQARTRSPLPKKHRERVRGRSRTRSAMRRLRRRQRWQPPARVA